MVRSFARAYLAAQKALDEKRSTPSLQVSGRKAFSNAGKANAPAHAMVDHPSSDSPSSKTATPARVRNQPSRGNTGAASQSVTTQHPSPTVRLLFRDEPRLGWSPEQFNRLKPLQHNSAVGASLQIHAGRSDDPRELVMGLDFGTSCTKVVIDDRQMQHRYAVPLVDAPGVGAYLLPARLNERDGAYTLDDCGSAFTDLKLALMASPQDDSVCARVCAYLALVIRASRSWLFTHHRDAFTGAEILWTLALGQPADQVSSVESRQLFEYLGSVAWQLAASEKDIRSEDALKLWGRRVGLSNGDEVEVVVMPEMAAQIHGFVSSQSFDSRNANIYLMVDVGAGTVDASIFRVKKDAIGTVSFSFFTNSVEAYGVANLHRHRVAWWQKQLEKNERGKSLISELEGIRLPTEYRGQFPESFKKYVLGISAQFLNGAEDPDSEFLGLVRNQVAGRVMFRAWKDQYLTQAAISGIPLFLCGGGTRHNLYKKLETRLQYTPNATWMNAKRRDLTLPPDLIAPGLPIAEYDRLSVAYGLSRLVPGQIKHARPMTPAILLPKASDWRLNYIEK